MTTINLAVIAGDGIGPEVVNEGLKVLDVVAKKYGVEFKKTSYDLGAAFWHRTGEVLPDATLAELAKADVILLGAVGDPTVPSGVLERGLLLKLRFAFDHYINLRPARLMPGVTGPLATKAPIDFVVVREGTEGPYVGACGVLAEGTDAEIATEQSLNTRRGAERVIRDAFERASKRDRKKLTLVHKNNVLTRAGGLWTRTFNEVAKEYPAITTDYLHVDAASMFFVTNPERFDVVVTDNLFGDILSDEAAMLTGSLGLLPSASLGAKDKNGKIRSMYEPVHGSAPDIAGKNIANPIATVLSLSMALKYSLDLDKEAEQLDRAVQSVLDDGLRTKDILSEGMKEASTSEMGDAIISKLQ